MQLRQSFAVEKKTDDNYEVITRTVFDSKEKLLKRIEHLRSTISYYQAQIEHMREIITVAEEELAALSALADSD